jgi:hypothetical protein
MHRLSGALDFNKHDALTEFAKPQVGTLIVRIVVGVVFVAAEGTRPVNMYAAATALG